MKRFLIVVCVLLAAAHLSAQTKPTIAILPFTGGAEDGETIAELFSFEPALTGTFTPIPRTSINRAIRNERNFQMGSGMTDSDTIIAIGKQIGAGYVLAGAITALGTQKLLIISIIDIQKLQQIAGDYQTYTKIEDVEGKLPSMARNIADAAKRGAAKLPKLAVVPFQLRTNATRDADALAQILAINIIRSGKYAVYPRTASLEQVQNEYDTALNGYTADEHLPNMGRGDNPVLALSGAARRLGDTRNMFNASIINLSSGVQEQGGSENYESLEDGMRAMQILAGKLTGTAIANNIPSSIPAGMVRIAGGTFMMGSSASEANSYDNEKPQHSVTVSSFYMGKYEVTQKEWVEVMGSNPSYFKGDNLPVEQVSWYDVIDYCNKRSQKEGLTPAYTRNGDRVTWNRNANGYRLPTEAEWEYACRAGTTTPYYTGNSVDNAGWYYNNSGNITHPVGQKQANAWGLYDMHGNVWEWCWDWYGGYSSGSQSNPAGAVSGSFRVLRGGSWNNGGRNVRSAGRFSYSPSNRIDDLGVRLLRPDF